VAKKSKDKSGKKSPKKEVGALKSKLDKLKRKLKKTSDVKAPAAAPASMVSPLAPAGGFPALPVIDGVKFAAAEAAVKKPGRLDVMLALIAPGSSVAGVFTRSSTRSAPVLDCQAKLAEIAAKGAGAKGFAIIANLFRTIITP